MSPSRKPRKIKGRKPTHVHQRHADDAAPPVEAAPPPAAPTTPAPDLAARIEILRDAVAREWTWLEERVKRLEDRVNRFEGTGQIEPVLAPTAPADVASAIRTGRIVLAGSRAAAPPVKPTEAGAPAEDDGTTEDETIEAAPADESTRPPVMFLAGRPSLDDWNALGAGLSRHPQRLALALHVARAATSGGGRLASHEEEQIATWFGRLVDEGIARTGGIAVDDRGGTDNLFARAVWHVLHTDSIRDARRGRSPRCPAMAEVPGPGERGFVDALRAAAPDYMRTVIAGARDVEVEELAMFLALSKRQIDERYRPFCGPFTEDVHHAEMYERALANLTRRYWTDEDVCTGVEDWTGAFAMAAGDHDIPPVARIGAVVWLARVALHEDEQIEIVERGEGPSQRGRR